MGQKVNPKGMRLGIVRDWDAVWYADKDQVAEILGEDLKIREAVREYYSNLTGRNQKPVDAAISRIVIERTKNKIMLTIYTGRPGVVIGSKGSTKQDLANYLQKQTNKRVYITIVDIKQPELDALLVAENIARQLEARASFRRVQKQAIERTMKAGAKGIKTLVSGRLGGAEMARGEGYNEGTVPLHTLRSDIDYATAEANTTYGKLGVKVWICRGEILSRKNKKEGK
ncbi:MAG TPA: 30S ribosomal protein S3 [Acholeplasma sp.]|jgi:small subunit ribosomal protein S3|nr:30S ribosomal protein S3 [Acholeplasma sp.]